MCFGEPLLYGKIPAQLLFGIERSSDDGICAVRPNEKFRSNGADLLCLQILIRNEKAAVFPFQLCADSVAVQLYRFRQERLQPKIEFMAIHIDIEPLIMANQLIF